MSFDNTVWDDIEFDKGQRVMAAEQVVIGYRGVIYELTLTDDNVKLLDKTMNAFLEVGRKVPVVKMPVLPKEIKVDDLIREQNGGPASSSVPSGDPAPGNPSGETAHYLPDGRVIPEKFWVTHRNDPNADREARKKLREKIKLWHGEDATKRGQIAAPVAYEWARAHPEEVPGL